MVSLLYLPDNNSIGRRRQTLLSADLDEIALARAVFEEFFDLRVLEQRRAQG